VFWEFEYGPHETGLKGMCGTVGNMRDIGLRDKQPRTSVSAHLLYFLRTMSTWTTMAFSHLPITFLFFSFLFVFFSSGIDEGITEV